MIGKRVTLRGGASGVVRESHVIAAPMPLLSTWVFLVEIADGELVAATHADLRIAAYVRPEPTTMPGELERRT